MTTVCFFLLIKSIILHLCSSKIAWDNYAPLQKISEYFPVGGRPLNRVKKSRVLVWNSNVPETSSYIEFEMLVDPGNKYHNP